MIKTVLKDNHVDNTTEGNSFPLPNGNVSSTWPPKNEKVRQDRIGDLDNILTLHLKDNLFLRVINYSPFGLAVQCDLPLEIPTHEIRANLLLRDTLVFNLNLRRIRVRELPMGGVIIGFEIVGKPIQIEHISTLIQTMDIIETNKEDIDNLKEIPGTFRLEVFELRSRLEQIEKKINSLSTQTTDMSSKDLVDFESTVTTHVANFLTNLMVPAFKALSNALDLMRPEIKQKALVFFRHQFEEFILKAPFANRSLMKPLGYAGDYEVMNLIYRDQPEGRSLFGKSLHMHFIDQPAAKAVRNRVNYIISHLDAIKCVSSSKPIRVLSVASGPAVELQSWLSNQKKSDRHFEIELLDQDINSLKHAQRCLMEIVAEMNIDCKISFFNHSIRKIITKGLTPSDYDLIYSLGLFDYLSDPICQALGKKLFSSVRKGGRLVIGNFDVDNPTRPIMELALDWKLIYRSSEDLERLFSPLGGRIEIEKEREGVNLFCIIRK